MAFTSGRSAVAGLLTTWLNRKFISDLEWVLQYQKFTTKAIIPPGSGKIGRFNVFAAPTAATSTTTGSYSLLGQTALTETYTTEHEIADITAASTDITVTEYGEFYKTSKLAMYAAVPGTREKLRKRLKDGAHYVIDSLCKTQYATSTNYLYANSDQDGGNTTWNTGSVAALGASTIMHARKLLFAEKAPTFDGISGHPDGHFASVLSPKQELDIVTEVTTGRAYWTQAVIHTGGPMAQEKWVNGYIGSIYGNSVYVTQNYDTGTYSGASTGDIGYSIADGGVGCMAFEDMEPSIIINDVNSPYKNTDSVAWHSFFGVGAIEANIRVVKMYSAS